MKYFEVLVNIKTETPGKKGTTNIKNVKETYLVDAMSCTEAEARVVKLFAKNGYSQDFEVVGVKGSKVVEVVNYEDVLTKVIKNDNQLPKDKENE
jgi:hypothetical protein